MLNKTNIVNVGGLDCYEKDGLAHLNLEQVARGLGFTTVQVIKGVTYINVRWNTVGQYLKDIGFLQEVAKDKIPDYIPENVFYRLAMKAKNETAEKFQAWVCDEVIPSIRKHGAYMTPEMLEAALLNPDTLIRLATELKAEREQKAALQAANAQLTESNAAMTAEIASFAPIKSYYEQILSSTGTMTTTQIAADYGMSAQKLNKILHEDGVQHKVNGQWILYRAQMEKGYTKSVTIPIVRANGEPDTKLHTQWTQKGRLMIHEVLTRRGVRANMDKAG